MKINDNKSNFLYTVLNMEDFSEMINTEWVIEWVKVNNCKDIDFKLQLI